MTLVARNHDPLQAVCYMLVEPTLCKVYVCEVTACIYVIVSITNLQSQRGRV